MNTEDCFAANEYEEKARETLSLVDENECHETRDLENKMDLDEEFDAIRSIN
ncbi:TPA: hypothetical protein ACW6D3_002679 [Legionella pneumophila]|uniref:hypothetical protein n=1 Tax=Legionella pneumophila TaxID=446 RepID=UPI000B2D617A|nr:hypothetical protein [Legionella pneumophila]HCC3243575.1 hypothetical protein [Legionella pneumophila subsp. pneumophila]MCZ4683316.1 hypothetical protein [Legionella pneumophila]HDV5789954.1 hypothetical protein [Legionella pneumophila]HDV5798937.1 hypothetical protein [Legionella pneumophila]HDV5948502.1 hypothetical protein [Legionella pneumophila]